MVHGTFMGMRPMGFLYLAGATGFLGYLSQAFTGPNSPKYEVDPAIALMAKETQPAIIPEHYFKREHKTTF